MRIECLVDPELVGSRWDLEGAYLLLRITKIVLFIDSLHLTAGFRIYLVALDEGL